MASEEDIGNILENKENLIKKACHEATKAHHESSNKLFIEKSGDSEVIFSFPGSWGVRDWYSEGPFGDTKINPKLFPSLRSIGVNDPAKVNQAFQDKFQSIIDKKELQKRVYAVKDKKRIVFTGHSSGGPIAVLAAIWFLEDLSRSKAQSLAPPLCITFGSPLVGNHIFSHALRRENWARHFVHFVARHDIIPRLFVSPFSSVEPHLDRALGYIRPQSRQGSRHAPDLDQLFVDVIGNALTVTRHAACKLMESTNLLLETLTGFVELSCYRPFGNYVFCDENNKLVSLSDSSEAVLQFLFYSIQPGSNDEARAIARKSLDDHLDYKTKLEGSSCGFYYGSGSDEDKLSGVLNHAANEFGLGPRGRLCLLAAAESEKQRMRNLNKVNKNMEDIKRALDDVERYRKSCEHRGVVYFDSFKLQKSEEDFKANVKRLELAGMWDEIIEMLKHYKLPDRFECTREWVGLGTRFRRLVEPLDVANYYRHLKNEDTGPYMDGARPKRYRFPQRWLEHAERLERGSCGESCFWAEVEELSIVDRDDGFGERASKLQSDLVEWTKSRVVETDVFLGDSSFVKLWKSLPKREMRIEEYVRQ